MSRLDQRADEREANVTAAAIEALAMRPPLAAPVLVAEDRALARELGGVAWSRWCEGDALGAAWPSAGPFCAATLRLPKSTGAVSFALHAVASVITTEAPLYVYGANDEGIRSASRPLAELFGSVETVWYGRKCRMLMARGLKAVPTSLKGFRSLVTMELDGAPRPWVTWPGLFAKGGLDEGTAELLAVAPTDGSILDFACGTGVVAATLLGRGAERVDAVDADALAVLATRENAPNARVFLGDGWQGLPTEHWRHIVSNPPIHRGKGEDYAVLESLIDVAPSRCDMLWLVAQREIPLERWLRPRFSDTRIVRETRRFRVWRCTLGEVTPMERKSPERATGGARSPRVRT